MTAARTWPPAERRGSARQPRNYLLTRQTRVEAYEHANREAARIILADPQRYAGLMADWARAVVEGSESEQRAWRLVA
jgi:hypothetical protein